MRESIWLNGEILPLADAKIGVEDRGYQFADGVYDVIRIYNNRPFTLAEHLRRLERSCADIELPHAFDRDRLATEILHFVEREDLPDGMVYTQVTRGAAPRNHIFPESIERPTESHLPREHRADDSVLHARPDAHGCAGRRGRRQAAQRAR